MADPLDPAFTTPRMAEIFSERSRFAAMLRFESALAQAEARAGVIPMEAAEAIAAVAQVDRFDVQAMLDDAAVAGTPAIPVVRRLTELAAEAGRGYVHWGATTQDATDTGLMLQAREGLDALDEDLVGLGAACTTLAEEHAATIMLGRTLLQQAMPITFGLKAARWLDPVTGRIEALRVARAGLPVQLGGAVGTLAALGESGPRVIELLAEELDLVAPALPWHTDRSLVAGLGSALSITAGTVAKIGIDVVLLSQAEVGEVGEGLSEGAGRSSAMPNKRNPVDAPAVIAAARLASASPLIDGMVQEHERGAGIWQAEWPALRDAFRYTAAAVHRARHMVEHLEVHPERMRENLEAGRGLAMAESLVMALARKVGRDRAYGLVARVVGRAREEGVSLEDAVRKESAVTDVLEEREIAGALDPGRYLGSSEELIRRAVARFRGVPSRS
ncbi:MAG: class-II fumarase/aspartase family protein [Actinomycetota bacterium]